MDENTLDTALKFTDFWNWLHEHHDCIVRAGTEDAWLHDDDTLHWHLRDETDGRCFIQLMFAKRILAEIVINSSEIAYVEEVPSVETPEHFEFQLFGGSGDEAYPRYHFVIAHGYDTSTDERQRTH